MDHVMAKGQHQALALLGVKDTGTTAGLVQLCCELRQVGILNDDAVERIKDAIASDILLACPRSRARSDYETDVRNRINCLLPHH